jgi:dihydrodipicolinate synthase/N-acetylneuraminate lyase
VQRVSTTSRDSDLGLGLAVPLLTVLDARGRLIEADQRRLVDHVLQAGHGAGIVFVMGTTGEWNRVDAATRHATIAVSIDAVARANASPPLASSGRAWVGVTAPDVDGTLACLDFALQQGADALVLAPLAIAGLPDPIRFVCDEVAPRLSAHGDTPLYLYDNAEIAVDPARPLLDREALVRLAALECVHGIKISAPRATVETAMANLAEVGASAHPFAVYIGYASMIFDVARSSGALGRGIGAEGAAIRLAGLVPGAANVLPRAWRLAWEACWAGDHEAMDRLDALVDSFRAISFVGDRRPIVATLKRALLLEGVIGDASVAAGTEALHADEIAEFDRGYAAVRARINERENRIPGFEAVPR